MTIKFSIITCTWNSKAYLAESIRSVVNQDHADIEYIFVDGGSDDGTLEEIAAVQRPTLVLRDVRGGIARAMNAGIEAATGDYVAHLHSDDFYLASDVLSRVADVIQQEGRAWLFGRSVSVINGRLIQEAYVPPRYNYAALLNRNFVPHAATFVRRSVFQELGSFSMAYRLAMDYEMWLRIGKKYPPSVLSEPLAAFRRHPNSATQANRMASLNEDFKARFAYAPMHRYPDFALRYLKRRHQLLGQMKRESAEQVQGTA